MSAKWSKTEHHLLSSFLQHYSTIQCTASLIIDGRSTVFPVFILIANFVLLRSDVNDENICLNSGSGVLQKLYFLSLFVLRFSGRCLCGLRTEWKCGIHSRLCKCSILWRPS